MKRFHLRRNIDETGISGTGRVAEGVMFANGWCAMVWLTKHTSCAFYASLDEVLAIHGHDGKTLVVMEDCPACDHAWSTHWMDGIGRCDVHPCPCNALNALKPGMVAGANAPSSGGPASQ